MPTKKKIFVAKKKKTTYTVLRSLVVWQQIQVEAANPDEAHDWALKHTDHPDWATTRTSEDWQPIVMKRRKTGGYDLV